MGRKQIVQVSCDRCSRVEDREGDSTLQPLIAFRAELSLLVQEADKANIVVLFQDLCSPCHKTVRHHFEMIGKTIEGLSPNRKKQLKDDSDSEEAD